MASSVKPNGPLLGYNNNIPHKGQIYHVQTEDSGAKRPHVITHLFADGGRIVKTTKTSYEEIVGSENLAEKVRAMMREQHKHMVVALRDGELDSLLEGGDSKSAGVAVASSTPATGTPSPDHPPAASVEAAASRSTPIEMLERAALAQQSGDALEEEILAAPSPPRAPSVPPSATPGGYSFVGSRSTPPPAQAAQAGAGAAGARSRPSRPSGAPARSLRRSGGPMSSDAPPATEVVGPRRRRRGKSAARAAQGLSAAQHATMPDPGIVAAHAGHGFGARHVSDRPFDQVVLAFLRREALIDG